MYVDDGAEEDITKALKAYCPPFDGPKGKFVLIFEGEGLQIFVFVFDETITFTEAHTKSGYYNLLPQPPNLTIGVPPDLCLPFNPLRFLPTFAADMCSFNAFKTFTETGSNIQTACFNTLPLEPLDENHRKKFFVGFLREHYPHILTEKEYRIESNYTRFRGRIDLIMVANDQVVSVHACPE